MRRLWPFTPRGTGALVLAVGCFIGAGELGLVELVYFGILLLAVVATSFATLYFAQRTESVERSLSPDTVSVGRESRVIVQVGARSALPTASGTWRDALPHGLDGVARGVFPALGSGFRGADRTVELEYTVTGQRRGIHSVGPLSVSTIDPFGLVKRTTVFPQRTRVTVAPAVVELSPVSDLAGETGGMLHVTNEQLGQGSDNLTPRAYVPGDSMRRIHWRATAHRDELMVRQEEQESTPEATVVLDRGALRWSPEALHAPGVDPGFEAGVAACVSVVARLVRDGYSVEVADSDGTLMADPIEGSDIAEVEAFVTACATVTTRRDDTLARLPHVFAGTITGPVVVILGRFDAADADLLAPLAHHTTFPLLLAVSPTSDALERAAAHGWRAGRLDPDADLAIVWADTVDRGVSHVVR
ncbi:DUF58 domain-containing protein [Microbacterium hominis]|uniref:DUF58 domain-containing protein n=1 Tax=Microbacterium hominis TaxID=162426 RepID=A0A7D4PTT4_9MICO|nr:DUF58 domain-containing protein [Microbacterium hominis]QKJ18754.1 DUF58 domain-containing protein [Microbacterium hominis]